MSSENTEESILGECDQDKSTATATSDANSNAHSHTAESSILPESGELPISSLLKCDTLDDRNSLLGRRLLCRGSGGLIVGATGTGKSVLALQLAVRLAIGKDFFGIRNTHSGPLKVLLVQAENDAVEVAEVLQSLTAGWDKNYPEDLKTLKDHLMVQHVWEKWGFEFVDWLRIYADKNNIDLVIIDPLLAYIGGNVSENDTIATFLRGNINGMLKKKGGINKKKFALLFVHHTLKPDQGKTGTKTTTQQTYDVLGGSELSNWARCIIRLDTRDGKTVKDSKGTITEVRGKGLYVLSVPKRGQRSGLRTITHQGENACFIQQAAQGKGEKAKLNLEWHSAKEDQD